MLFAGALSAAEFHINSEADVLAEADAEGYIGVSVSKVTEDLGSPSMVRNNLSDADQIDYIYIGESSVYAFAVMKELGKEVTASTKYGRPEWESSVYPLYPAKN
ncbi:MAG: hypothetical protein A3G87_02910 [Omnitrophica bacterium RIFCSPLOWO2_12_FULL_50_11]|nr:MAG: hypothetical protein A3G87_02910 [Omnitrophica bacterium RIFCSPLOWO2_12_FULL_50_11]